ncbi:hypothetical protein [Clostridium sp. Marseille-P2415]|uniref:hypothetical protein n=1 Tax=Clostridium sp. Marseille-P2415 TaxID=1805471 RepID=UPI0009888ED9|nr:hypothetical protein [Clostridium sp. Marseille-P2415]
MTKEVFQRAIHPIRAGLFGNQETRGYRRPYIPVRSLGEMLRDLAAIEPVDWYSYAFSREPLNGKLKDEQRRSWMKKSLDCGREYAHKICREYQTEDPDSLADSMGITITYPEFPEKTDRVLFAEFRVPDKICIYMDAVKKAKKLFEEPGVAEILTKELDIRRLLLSHELFHSVEERCKEEIYTKNEKIRLWSVGFFHNDSNVIALSEIAAMGFAQEITGIRYSPYLMDVFLVYSYSPEEAGGLYEEMMERAANKE